MTSIAKIISKSKCFRNIFLQKINVFDILMAKSINNVMQNCKNHTIGIIDSGIGGVSILKQLIEKYKSGNYIYFADNLFMPYGNKNSNWLKKRINYIVEHLINNYDVDCIIVACNTASTVIDKKKYTNLHAMTFEENQIYFGTELTKRNLLSKNVISDKLLAKMIEKHILDNSKINTIVRRCVQKHHLNELKHYILGCTHYELLKPIFEKFCPNTKIINNSSFLIKDIKLVDLSKDLNIVIVTSKKSNSIESKILKLIKNND